jgi:hypothetical protein
MFFVDDTQKHRHKFIRSLLKKIPPVGPGPWGVSSFIE